jgi:hypothetical protein
MMERFDPKLGGFGSALKFPRPAEVNALLLAAQQAAVSARRGLPSLAGWNFLDGACWRLLRLSRLWSKLAKF